MIKLDLQWKAYELECQRLGQLPAPITSAIPRDIARFHVADVLQGDDSLFTNEYILQAMERAKSNRPQYKADLILDELRRTLIWPQKSATRKLP